MTLHAELALLDGPPTAVVAGIAVTRAGRPPGEAPTLVLIHGVGAARLVWAPVLAPLSARYDVIVVDLPGHGASPPLPAGADAGCPALASRLAGVLRRLDAPHPHLAGNSLGGWVALELAADGEAASVTALAPAGLRLAPGEPSPLLRVNRLMARLAGRPGEALATNATVRRLTFASGSTDPAALDPGLARGVARALRGSTGYEAMIAATRRLTFTRGDRVTVPVTVAFGDRDRILPAPDNQRRGAVPPGARWVVLPRCGHAPMWDASARTVELIETTTRSAGAAV
ncbi:MAG: alpha/beta fold hydrolase [Kineosporiaceae bacterium]